MNIDSVTLHCFLAVADTGSFTKAAEHVSRTQSAVSQQISKLENLLGKSLFTRGTILSLTIEGEIFLSYARQIFDLHLEALDRFKEPHLEGEIRFGLPDDFAPTLLSDVLMDFVHTHPRILLNIECDLTLNLFDRFKKGLFDLILVKMSNPQDIPNVQEVWSEKLQWIGDKKLLECLVDKKRPLPLILSPQPCIYRAKVLKALDDASIKWQVVFSSQSYNVKIAAVKAGLGITVLPKSLIPNQIKTLDDKCLPNLSDAHICLLKHNTNSLAINSFEDFVLKKLRK